jgi:hypothetical protein
MDEDLRNWILAGIIVFLLSFILGMSSCVSPSTYVMPDGTMVELPKTPTDSVKGGGR